MLIQQAGYYRGIILDGGFGTSPGGFPQVQLMLQATAVYDPEGEEGEEYLEVNPETGTESTYYGVLYDSKDNETLNSRQVKKVTGWDGGDFEDLRIMAYANMPIQFRVEPDTYNNKIKLKVTWIDEEGASPLKTVPKLGKEETAAIQARYAGILAANKSQAPVQAPVSVGPSAVAGAGTEATKPPVKRKRRTKPEIEADKAAKAAVVVAAAEAAAGPTTTTPPGRPTTPGEVVGTCTADEAWAAAAKMKREDVLEAELAEKWRQTLLQHLPGGIEADATPETWFKVKQDMLTKVGRV